MSKQNNGFTGSCLCGQVKYVASGAPILAGHCHCEPCRKVSGNGHTTNIAMMAKDFEVTGEVKFYDAPSDSGSIVSRGFCGNCGSPIYSKNSNMPEMVFPKASSLDDPEVITPGMVVYASKAPSWDHVDPNLPSFALMPEGDISDFIKGQQGE